ncbi:MAG: YitT family protein [Lachnospiraceae bacterium]|nr:YitT family protein [Lachnospiraceae bacterium]
MERLEGVNWKAKARKLALILLGNAIYSAGVAFFVIPYDMLTGGTTGLALIVQRFFDVPVTLFVAVFNVATFLLGLWILGWGFAATTLVSTFFYPAILQVWQMIAAEVGILSSDILLSTIFAGVMIGVGLGMVIREGASTGGMDIPPLVINKYTGIAVSALLTVFDMSILIGRAIFYDSEQIMYGILLVITYNLVLEQMLVVGKRQVQISIISEKYEEINQWITHELDRGSTLVSAEGGYLRRQTMEVVTVVSKREVFKVNEKVKEIDPEAFIIIGQVTEVRGRGFTTGRVYR